MANTAAKARFYFMANTAAKAKERLKIIVAEDRAKEQPLKKDIRRK